MRYLQIIALLAFLMPFSTAFAQQDPDLTSAILNDRNGLLDKAKIDIDKAAAKPKINTRPKVWYYRGTIYSKIASSQIPIYSNLAGDSGSLVAKKCFDKVNELGKPDDEFVKLAKDYKENTWANLVNAGIKIYNDKNAARAFEHFRAALQIKPNDTLSLQNAAIIGLELNDYPQARAFYNQYLDLTKSQVLYGNFQAYLEKKGDKAEQTSLTAYMRERFPTEKRYMLDELNQNLASGNNVETKSNLEKAIMADPKNASLYLTLGSIQFQEFQKSKSKELESKALGNFTKALDIDSTNYDANFNAGVIHYNRGVDVLSKVAKMDLPTYQRNGRKVEAEGRVHYKKALPFLERAYKSNAKDSQLLRALTQITGALNQKASYAKYDAELQNMMK